MRLPVGCLHDLLQGAPPGRFSKPGMVWVLLRSRRSFFQGRVASRHGWPLSSGEVPESRPHLKPWRLYKILPDFVNGRATWSPSQTGEAFVRRERGSMPSS